MKHDKLEKLNKYATKLKDQLEAPLPKKHLNHPEEYKQFLKRELGTVNSQIEKLKYA